MKRILLKIAAGLATGFATLATLPAFAVPLVYEADLTDGDTRSGTVAAFSGSDFGAHTYYSFVADEGDEITVTVLRDEFNHDPQLRIWQGEFSDTDALGIPDLAGDDELPATGPFGDPQVQFTASAGFFTVGVADFDGLSDPCDGLCEFLITVTGTNTDDDTQTAVPEPGSLVLMLASLAALRLRRQITAV